MSHDPVSVLRFLFATAVWLLPGFALARGLHPHLPLGDRLLRVAVAFSFAAAVATGLAFLSLVLRIPADRFDLVLLASAAVSLAWLLFGRRLLGPPPLDAPPAGEDVPPPPWTQYAGFATLALLAVAGLLLGAAMRYTSDAPDHVGYLREILASRQYFPTEAFHLDAGLLGADARKGLLHPVYAALSQLAGLAPLDFWTLLPLVTALFPFLGAYGFLRLAGFAPRWSVTGAWLVLLTWAGGPAADLIGISPFPNNLGATLFWFAAGTGLFLMRHSGRPAVILAVGAAFAAVAVHPMFLVFVMLFYGLMGLYALVAAPHRGRMLGKVLLAGGLAAALLLPYLVYRYRMYAPENPIHTHLQGMLLLGHGFFTADPGLMWKHLRWTGLVAYPIALVLYLPRWRRDPSSFFIGMATLLMLNFTFNPLLVPLLQKSITYLIFRSFWFFHPGLAAGAVLPLLFATKAARHPRWRRAGAAAVLAATIVPSLLALPSWATTSAGRYPRLDPLTWRKDFEEIDRLLPPRSIVLSDPITSHMLPAFGTQKVVAAYDQHSPPNDARAVERILTVRDVLSPGTSPARAWRLANEAGAAYVLIDLALVNPPPTGYWMYDESALRRRARTLAASPLFTPIWESDGFILFRLNHPSILSGPMDESEPSAALTSPVPARADTLFVKDGVALLAARPSTREIVCGDSLQIALLWTVAGPPTGSRPVSATLRLDALDAPGRGSAVSKLIRKIDEKITGRSFRDRLDWIPTGNRLPPDRWTAGRAVADTVAIRPSCRLEPGRYTLRVTVNRLPHMPNYRLKDYLSDDDLYSGPAVDTLVVRAR